MVGSLVGVTQKVTPLLQKPTVQLGEVDLCDPLPTLYWLVWDMVFCRPIKASIAAVDQDCNVYTMLRWHFASQCSLSSLPAFLSFHLLSLYLLPLPLLPSSPLYSTLLSFFEEDFFYFISIWWVFCLHICLCTMWIQCPWSSEEMIRFSVTKVTNGCVLLLGFLESNLGPIQEHEMVLNF